MQHQEAVPAAGGQTAAGRSTPERSGECRQDGGQVFRPRPRYVLHEQADRRTTAAGGRAGAIAARSGRSALTAVTSFTSGQVMGLRFGPTWPVSATGLLRDVFNRYFIPRKALTARGRSVVNRPERQPASDRRCSLRRAAKRPVRRRRPGRSKLLVQGSGLREVPAIPPADS